MTPQGTRSFASHEGRRGRTDQYCSEWLISLLDQRLASTAYDSPVVYFLSITGIRPDGRWISAQHNTPLLSTVIRIARRLVALDALLEKKQRERQEERSQAEGSDAEDYAPDSDDTTVPSMFDLVRGRVSRFMTRVGPDEGSYPTPMNWMLNLRTYGLKIQRLSYSTRPTRHI